MKVRFQTDADFDRRIVRATLRREPAIDLQLATATRGGAGLRERMLISVAVEWIMTIWAASEAEEWTNHILILPR